MQYARHQAVLRRCASSCDRIDYMSSLLTAAGAVALYAGGLLTETWRSRLANKAAVAEREELRRQQRQDRREDFELAALLELQDVVLVMARQIGIGDHSDDMHYRKTGSWKRGAPLLPEEAGGEASLAATRSFLKLKPRIPSEKLRGVLEAFHESCAHAAVSPFGDGTNDAAMRDEARRRMTEMTDRLEAAQDAIGARIRELHAD